METEIKEVAPSMIDYIHLHKTTGWNGKGLFTYNQLYTAICNSWYCISIYHESSLIGYGRIVSDGIYQTFICDVMVHPTYQRLGIGSQIIELLLKKCEAENIKWVQLFSAKGKQNFYKIHGFSERDSDAPGMSIFL
ncbi:GNAT family N-acetyltransferase [Aquibacillus kalidii]|uniref:GNAT family N-acetyltransferase n=1 Tax=Aquibacillus kalidii TaxID=2762597 RepID=UPI0016447A63|nr:GNAT family N-acetyltransferase [Aquibacillus kalidii]